MTFSLLGRCERTGQLGACTTTSDVAVGARVPFAAAGVGAVLTQHRTDPRLGPRGLELLRSGCGARETLDALVASTAQHAWRQLAVIDEAGRTAAFSGTHHRPRFGESSGRDCVAIGNVLASDDVVPAMVGAFEGTFGETLAERLVRALEAGLAAGGEEQPLVSAAILVVDTESFPFVDLRVDAASEPLGELRRLWERYAPWARAFVGRALEPDAAAGAPS